MILELLISALNIFGSPNVDVNTLGESYFISTDMPKILFCHTKHKEKWPTYCGDNDEKDTLIIYRKNSTTVYIDNDKDGMINNIYFNGPHESYTIEAHMGSDSHGIVDKANQDYRTAIKSLKTLDKKSERLLHKNRVQFNKNKRN